MKTKLPVFLFVLIAGFAGECVAQITESPKVEEQSAEYVKIKKVELTGKYTIVYLQFREREGQQRPPSLSDLLGGRNKGNTTIWLDPETRLYKPGEISTKFKFIRAENIPTGDSRKSVIDGETVDFVAYFERLSPGIEIFDFYEGRPTNPGEQTWNFYGIHIKNPLNKESPKKAIPAKPEAKKEPSPATDSIAETDNTTLLKGIIFDSKTKAPISAEIDYVEKGDSMRISTSSGKFKISVDPSEVTQIQISANGYYGQVVSIDSDKLNSKNGDGMHIFLSPLKKGETIALQNIYFETSKFAILKESEIELTGLVSLLKDNPKIKIRVEGHTDNVGDFDKNVELSQKRAQSVKEFLVNHGIDESRIGAKGYGGTRPIAQGNSEADRKQNRRVEFVITDI